MHVNNLMGWQHSATQRAFEKTVGNNYSDMNQCNDRADLLTLEAILTTKELLN